MYVSTYYGPVYVPDEDYEEDSDNALRILRAHEEEAEHE